MKWIAPILVYLTVGLGLFWIHSAWGALLGFHFAILFSLLIARPNIPLTVLFKNTDIKWLLLSILLCGSSGVTLYFLWPYIGLASGLSRQVAALGLDPSNQPMFIAYFALINPFVEEYFWRGYLGSHIKGLHISDLLYAGFHALILLGKVQVSSIIIAVILLVLAGWFWRQIAREGRGLLGPVLGHMAADFTILMAIFLNV